MRRPRRNPELRPSPYGKNLAGKDLRGKDLSYMDLKGADLTKAVLTDADLTGARLHRADMAQATLYRARLTSADLRGADLTKAVLRSADLSGANLEGAYLNHAIFAGARLTGTNFANADLAGADLAATDFTNANLTGVRNAPPHLGKTSRLDELREHYKIEAPTSAAFKRWFGESVVVGDDRKPVVVYHGTPSKGFVSFDPGSIEADRDGFYFTDSFRTAATYTRSTPGKAYTGSSTRTEIHDPALNPTLSGGIFRLYIRLVNPLVIEGHGNNWDQLSDPRVPGGSCTLDFAVWAMEHGHDGVIFKNIFDDASGDIGQGAPTTVYAVFDPKAIKSATANNGNFDPDDADIRHNPRRARPARRR